MKTLVGEVITEFSEAIPAHIEEMEAHSSNGVSRNEMEYKHIAFALAKEVVNLRVKKEDVLADRQKLYRAFMNLKATSPLGDNLDALDALNDIRHTLSVVDEVYEQMKEVFMTSDHSEEE